MGRRRSSARSDQALGDQPRRLRRDRRSNLRFVFFFFNDFFNDFRFVPPLLGCCVDNSNNFIFAFEIVSIAPLFDSETLSQ